MKRILWTIVGLGLFSPLLSDTVKNLRMEIESTKISEFFEEPSVSKITAEADTQGRLRWATKSPFESEIIANDDGVFQFEKTDGKWMQVDLPASSELREYISKIASAALGDYSGFDSKKISPQKIELYPKPESQRKHVKKILIELNSENFPDNIKIFFSNGDLSVLKFLKCEKNVEGIDFWKYPTKLKK